MSDLVGNSEDRFSCVAAHMIPAGTFLKLQQNGSWKLSTIPVKDICYIEVC